MSNPEFINLNNNEVSTNATEDRATIGNGFFNKELDMKSYDFNVTYNTELTGTGQESNHQEDLFEIGKNTSSTSENKLNILSDDEKTSSGSNENNLSDVQMGGMDQHNFQHKESQDGSESYSNNECLPSASSQTDAKLNKVNLEVQHDKPQTLSCNFNIVPNPNEFNLLKKKNPLLKNPDILNVSQSTNELLAFSDNSIVISNSNAIPQSDSIVSSNYSLSQLQQYMSDDEDSVIEELPAASKQYRDDNPMEDSGDDSDSSTSSSTSIIISETSSDSESEDEYENFSAKPISKPIKAKGELDLDDLPPIEDLTITVPEEECIPIGKVYQIVDQQVIVQAIKDSPAYDLDTILFTEGGKPLGKVFDVMGPVTEPYYCIRFNSKDHIKEKNITLDQTIYAAPKTQYSKYVFLAQLMQLKGSDASWENDVEPPEIYLDYSDDEQEQKAKKKYRNKKAVNKTDSDPDEPARKRHSAYVKRMNARNLRLTAARGNQNPSRTRNENGSNILWQPNLPPIGAFPSPPRAAAPCHQMFGRPPLFDLRVPLPNSPFPSQSGQSHRHEFSFPQPFAGTSRAPGPPPFSRHSNSPGPVTFPQNCMSPGPMPFSRPFTPSGPPPFPPPCASPGPPPFPQHCASPGPMPFPRPCGPPGHPPFPRPGASSGPQSFSRHSPAPGPSSGARVVPPPYFQSPCNQRPAWNPSPDPWAPQRNTPPPFASFQFSGPQPIRNGSPQGPLGAFQPPWHGQMNNRGNSTQYIGNNSFPPHSPNRSQ